MKRVIIASFLITACLFICIYFGFSLNSKYDTLSEELNTALKFSEELNYGQMKTQAKKIESIWDKYHAPFSMLITHSHFDELDQYINQLPVNAEERSIADYNENCQLAIYELNHLKKSQRPDVENIF